MKLLVVFNVLRKQWRRVLIYGSLLVLILSGCLFIYFINKSADRVSEKKIHEMVILDLQFNKSLTNYRSLKKRIVDYKILGIDTSATEKIVPTIYRDLFVNKNYARVDSVIEEENIKLNILYTKKMDEIRLAQEAQQKADDETRLKAELEASKGVLAGIVSCNGTMIGGATIKVLSGKTTIISVNSAANGNYSMNVAPGKYRVTASKSGYVSFSKENVEIITRQSTTLDISLTKYVPKPSPPATTNSSTNYSNYVLKNISTSRGVFSAHVATFNMGSGHIKVVTDTAADYDCTNNCPTISLASYVSRIGGFAAINGTYFCPTDYSFCAGKTNSFYWKIYNSRLGKMMNTSNPLGQYDPFLIINSSGLGVYIDHWADYASVPSMVAGISSSPSLIKNGQIVLNESSLDTKQRTTRSNRGAVGVKGSTFYAVIAKNATVTDLAAVMSALGVDSALNVDGGGSSAMIYNNSYKVGPGRALPNAVIFVEY